MATYEYKCQACKHEFEKEQKISDEPEKICPKCKKAKAKRLIAKTTFLLNGSGWYRDGYSGKNR